LDGIVPESEVARRAPLKREASVDPPAVNRDSGTARRDTLADPLLRVTPVMQASGLSGRPSGPEPGDLPMDGGGGRPLDAAAQGKMDTAFGADFSAVRVHEGPRAASLGADAVAQGTDIHIRARSVRARHPKG
jgi:hypothetical protein